MFYDKKIRYFEERQNGQRVRTAGFVKLEVRGEVCNLLLQLSGFEKKGRNIGRVELLGGDKEVELCELTINQGKGVLQQRLDRDELCPGISYDGLEAIRIRLEEGRELYCTMGENVPKEVGVENFPQEDDTREMETSKPPEQEVRDMEAAKPSEQKAAQYKEPEYIEEEEPENITEVFKQQPARRGEGKFEGQAGKQGVPLLEDKWKQLSSIYAHVNPFQDDREYLSIGPGDFVIFGEKYYRMVNNSFLLHGYYNYKHLILARLEGRGEHRYYVGVPGNFYEREKQVALMFGFESFECQEEPARSGDYGYYMMRVEL